MSLKSLQNRLNYLGGDANSRIKKQKYDSFCAALLNDYNSRKIQLEDNSVWQALINLSNLKPDYDKKYISIDHASRIEPGDTFKLLDNHTHWMVYLPDLVETAYIRSEIIRCRYTLDIEDKQYWIYFQGPTETDIRWALNHGMTYNELNLSGTIFIKNCAATKNFFSRFKRFKIDGHTWEAQVVDSISVPGILEVEVQEYFDNIAEELPEIEKQPDTILDDEVIQEVIIGKKLCKRGETVGFSIAEDFYKPGAFWKVIGNDNVKIRGTHLEGRICEVEVKENALGNFILCYDDKETITVKIESIKPDILGPIDVYPYETYTYTIDALEGKFHLNTPLAKIVEEKDNTCTIEILSGKKGSFELFYNDFLSDKSYSLPIKIHSL